MMEYSRENIKYIHSLGARVAVGYALSEISQDNKNLVAVYADVGSRFEIPQRMKYGHCLEIGIAEQSLISILGGLYHEGMIPFGVAYAPFITMRAADQIRMTIGEMGLGIKLIGGSAGLVSGNLGSASLCLDDLAMMRAIPNLTIICPSDSLAIVKTLEFAAKTDKPIYIRLTGGTSVEPVYKNDFVFDWEKSRVVYEAGRDAVLYGCGMQVASMIKAAIILQQSGVFVTVVDMHTIKPLDTQILDKYSDCGLAVTAEEHNIIGGLGTAVAEFLTANSRQPLLRLGIRDRYPAPDTYENLLQESGLTPDGIALSIKAHLERRNHVNGCRKKQADIRNI